MNRADRRKSLSPATQYGITGTTMQEVPRDLWPDTQRNHPAAPVQVFMSRDFMAQLYPAEPPAMARLSIHSVHRNGKGWLDNIPWETLQRIKFECGMADVDAIEIYPRERDVVNVANIRHLWLVPKAYLPFAWRKS